MIQRIQTVFWLLVCGLMLVLLFVPSSSASLLLPFEEVCIAVLSVAAISLYKKRIWQVWCGYLILVWLLLDCARFLVSCFPEADSFPSFCAYTKSLGISLPATIVALILNYLAIHRVKKDEKLVRSLDRLR
jgi:hypothetical protein